MQASKATTRSRRVSQLLAAVQIAAAAFAMNAMVGGRRLQLKVPRLDAYAQAPHLP